MQLNLLSTRMNLLEPSMDAPTEALVSTLVSRIEALEKGVKAAADALDEAAEDIADWGGYASDYFQEKHHLVECVAQTKATAFNLRTLLAAKA